MRMLQPCGELYLTAKTVDVNARGKIRREHLDHNLPIELRFCGNENAGHAGAAELAIYTVCGAEYFLELCLEIGRHVVPGIRDTNMGSASCCSQWFSLAGTDSECALPEDETTSGRHNTE